MTTDSIVQSGAIATNGPGRPRPELEQVRMILARDIVALLTVGGSQSLICAAIADLRAVDERLHHLRQHDLG